MPGPASAPHATQVPHLLCARHGVPNPGPNPPVRPLIHFTPRDPCCLARCRHERPVGAAMSVRLRHWRRGIGPIATGLDRDITVDRMMAMQARVE